MTGLATILQGMRQVDGGWRALIPPEWQQGRTAYGGLSAALALHAAKACGGDLPPLRSAQVAFVGPLSGEVTVAARLLRRGRTATFVAVEIAGAAGIGLDATFVFMAPIASALDHRHGGAPDVDPPEAGTVLRGHPAIAFTGNFEMVELPAPADTWLRWVRLVERDGLDAEVAFLALADALPPAALKLLGAPAPVSSVTWHVDMLEVPASDDGWFLLRTSTLHAAAGVSSQPMAAWDRSGRWIAEGLQSVALFA